jgi:C1A family cysteine protease
MALTEDRTLRGNVVEVSLDGGRRRQQRPGMGWLRDQPDVRDYSGLSSDLRPNGGEVRQKLARRGAGDAAVKADGDLPASVDLRGNGYFSPVEDQGRIGSCTANAGAALVEYYQRKEHGHHVDVSRLFLYKATRNLMHMTGDTGGYLRTTMKALATFGVPPEEFWPYDEASYDDEPSAFCYAFGREYEALQYYRLDPPGVDPATLLTAIKGNVAKELPAMFGFTVYATYTKAAATGEFPYPGPDEHVVGGHAIVVAGYDDDRVIATGDGKDQTHGALLIRNSWGEAWGEGGFGWLPYEYVMTRLAADFWSVISMTWEDEQIFADG